MKKSIRFLFCVFLLTILASTTILAQIELILWDHQTEAEPGHEMIKDAIARFEADHPGVKIRHVPTKNDSYKVKLQVAMAANDEPDIFMTWGGGGLKSYVDAGKVYDMTDMLVNSGYINRFIPAGIGTVSFDGRHYGVPVISISGAFFGYRPSMFEKYGVEVPETWEELVEVAQVFIDNGVIPFALANATKWTGSLYYMYLVDRIGGPETFQKAFNREGSFTDEPFIKAGEMIQDLVKMGAFPKGVNGLREDQGQARMLLYTERAAMYLMLQSAYSLMKSENPAVAEELDIFRFPMVEGGKGNPTNLIGSAGNNYYSISNKCKHKELAFKFLQYITDDKAQEMLVKSGSMPPTVGTDRLLDDEVNIKMYQFFSEAEYVQLYYDQTLPPELAEVHKDTMHGLFGLTMTPEEVANTLEEAARKYYNED